MNIEIRITRELLEYVRADLSRPHRFAAERVGFLYGKLVDSAEPLLLITGYEPVADDRYIDDARSGARIDSGAIRMAMQGVLDRGQGGFHVHAHDMPGQPVLSRMDAEEIPPVVTGMRRAGVADAHGIILLHQEECASWVWLPGGTDAIEAASFSVVGFPIRIFRREYHAKRSIFASILPGPKQPSRD